MHDPNIGVGFSDGDSVLKGRVWAKAIGTINQLHDNDIIPSNGVQRLVGDENSTLFWKDYWISNNSLMSCSLDCLL